MPQPVIVLDFPNKKVAVVQPETPAARELAAEAGRRAGAATISLHGSRS